MHQKSWVERPCTTGPSRRAGTNVSSATSRIVAMSRTTNVGVSVRIVPGPAGAIRLPASEPATASGEHERHEAAGEHRHAAEQVGERDPERAGVARRVGLHEARVARERRAVVVGLRGVGVERLREALRPGVEDRRRAVLRRDRERGRDEHEQRHRERARSTTSLTSRASIFLPRNSGVRPTMRPGDEDREQDEQQHPVEARADAAEDDLAESSCSTAAPRRRCR